MEYGAVVPDAPTDDEADVRPANDAPVTRTVSSPPPVVESWPSVDRPDELTDADADADGDVDDESTAVTESTGSTALKRKRDGAVLLSPTLAPTSLITASVAITSTLETPDDDASESAINAASALPMSLPESDLINLVKEGRSKSSKGKEKSKEKTTTKRRATKSAKSTKASRAKATAAMEASGDEDEDDALSHARTSRRDRGHVSPEPVATTSRVTEVAHVDEDDDEDDRVYCLCLQRYDPERMMIACDRCDDWYHTDNITECTYLILQCIGMLDDDIELVNDFICPRCEPQTDKRTTWKVRCGRSGCNKASVPLSKYCSDWCGIEVAATRLERVGIEPMRFWNAVAATRKKRGVVVLAPGATLISSTLPSSPAVKLEANGIDINGLTDGFLESPAPAMKDDHDAVDEQEARRLHDTLAKLATRRHVVDAALALVVARLRFLALAVQRADALRAAYVSAHPDVDDSADGDAAGAKNVRGGNPKAKAKSGKKKLGAVNASDEAPCGFDVRLVWEDRDWVTWVASDEGRAMLAETITGTGTDTASPLALDADAGVVCQVARRRCDRHSGWSRLIEASFEAEEAAQTRRLDKLAADERQVRLRLEDLEEGRACRRRWKRC